MVTLYSRGVTLYSRIATLYSHRFTIIDTITVERPDDDLMRVKNSEARILLLYSTKAEGEKIMLAADSLGLTGKNYVWIVTQSIIGENLEGHMTFPVGMLGE